MTLDIIIEKRNSSRITRIISHILFWIVLYISSYYIVKISYSPYRDTPLSYLAPLRHTIGLIVVFYPLMYVLIPQYLMNKRWVIFIAYFSFLNFLYIFIDALGEKMTFYYCDSCRLIAEDKHTDHLSVIQKSIIDNFLYKASNIGMFFNLWSSLILPIAIKSSLGYYQFYTKNLQLEKEKVQLELNFLKAQVNPHFLFNTLNNLYGLIIHKRIDASAETVTRLSDFMRYSLENAHKRDILLTEEINLIKNYIELESLRLNHTKVSFTTNSESHNNKLPPLLFIPLIENAFKYNIDKKGTTINLTMHLENDVLNFKIENSFEENNSKNDIGGLGLTNLKKRLVLYFSDKYRYDYHIENSIYTARLKLNLK